MAHPKIDYLFTCYDHNRDGRLDVSDFFGLARAIRTACNLDDKDARSARINRAFDAYWEMMLVCVDTDGSGDVDRTEFLAFEHLMAEQTMEYGGQAPPWALELYDAIFDAFDANNDGHIDVTEYANYLRATGSTMDAAAAFARLDLNGDGSLDVHELEWLLAAYFTSTNPEDRAHWLLTGGWPA